MAGMDWFRWHHGSVTDPKFQLVAKRSGASVAEVLAVWAFLLEEASQSEDRGNPGQLDFDSIDCALGLDDGISALIHKKMQDRGLIDREGRLEAWDRRQVKREREDNTGAERQRNFRAKKDQVTPSNATSHQKTPRVDKSRQEENKSHSVETVEAAATPPATPEAPKKTEKRGARLPDDWHLPKPWGEWALEHRPGWVPDDVRECAARFADYWRAKAGKDAVKLDWEATWRNWVRNDTPRKINGNGAGHGGPAPPGPRPCSTPGCPNPATVNAYGGVCLPCYSK